MAKLLYTSLLTDASLKAYYPLSADLITDNSGQGITLTNNNVVTLATPGPFENCASFGSSNTNSYLSNASTLGINGGNISMACWVKVLTEPSNATYIFMYQGSTTNNVTYRTHYDDSAGTKTLTFRRERAGTANDDLVVTISALGTSTWHHIVFTYDGTNSRGYQDGQLIGTSGAISGNGAAAPVAGISLGAVLTTAAQPASVQLADCAYLSRAISLTEVGTLYTTNPSGASLFF